MLQTANEAMATFLKLVHETNRDFMLDEKRQQNAAMDQELLLLLPLLQCDNETMTSPPSYLDGPDFKCLFV